MKKLATILILFLSVGCLGIRNAKADSLPSVDNLVYSKSNYIIFHYTSEQYYSNSGEDNIYLIFLNETVPITWVKYDSGYYGNLNVRGSGGHPNNYVYSVYQLNGSSWNLVTNSGGYGYNPAGGNYHATVEIYKTTIDIYTYLDSDYTNSGWDASVMYTNLTYPAGYELAGDPELHITDSHNSTTHEATITVDTSDFSEGNYKYKWGYDQMAMAMQEVVSGTNGFTLTVPYNDTIYFAVLEQDDTLVYETTYTIDYEDMPNQYALHFHSYTSWGCNDIVKFVNDNTDYTSPNFWEAGEKLIFFWGYQRRVALGFYADSNLTNRLSLDGSVEFDHDAEIYVKWSTKIPDYQIRVYPDDDTIKFRFQITEWLEESRNYQILFNQDIYHVNYTMVYGSRQDGYTTPVDYDENVTIRVVYTENGETVTVWTEEIDISVWVALYASEDDQEAINLIVEASNVNNHIQAWEVLEDFVELLRVPIDFIIGLITHLYNKLNLHTRVFLIGVFVAEMMAAVAKLMFKR